MNVKKFISMKGKQPITMVTAYDYFGAKMCEEVGIDAILVGDSLGNVVLGYDTTLKVEMTDILRSLEAVRRGAPNSFVIADMPFMSYQISTENALKNAGTLLKHGANAVKLEGGKTIAKTVERLVNTGIPVMGHLGLTPQSVNQIGGYKVQGKGKDAYRMVEEAKLIQESGAFALVLELTVEETAKAITEAISIPTIGIGAGRYCDGQVLVWHDLLGISEVKMKFVKRYANLADDIKKALKDYISEVRNGDFPKEEHTFREGKG